MALCRQIGVISLCWKAGTLKQLRQQHYEGVKTWIKGKRENIFLQWIDRDWQNNDVITAFCYFGTNIKEIILAV